MGLLRSAVQKREAFIGSMDGLLLARNAWRDGAGTAGQNVNKNTVATVPSLHRAWSFGANAVASMTLGSWRDTETFPQQVSTTAAARLLAGIPNPTQDYYQFKYIIEKSLEARGNAYLWKTKNSQGQVVSWTALHPDQVFPYLFRVRSGGLVYPVIFNPWYPKPPDVDGIGFLEVDSSVILHIRGDGGIGEIVTPSPITQFAASIGIALAKIDYEASLYANGVLGGTSVAFPEKVTPTQAAEWKDVWVSQNTGTGNAATTKVIGGGATITQIGMTQRDAQFVEAGHMTLVDVCNMTGVPLWVVGAADKTDKSTPEMDEARWFHHGLKPRIKRICSAIQADPDIYGPGAKDYPMFDTADSIHPDSQTADNIAHQRIQDGRILPDEWRAANGLPDLPDGLGKIPQITPVGGAPNASTGGAADE